MADRRKANLKGLRKNEYFSGSARLRVSSRQRSEAVARGREDAQNTPFEVKRSKATPYEKELQHRWEQNIGAFADEAINRLNARITSLQSEIRDLLQAKAEFAKRLLARDNVLSDVQLKAWVYGVIMAFIVLIEMPINITVFYAFGESAVFTAIIAGMLSLLLALLAHFLGGWIKSNGLKLKHLALILAVCCLIGIISWIRLKYFSGDTYNPLNEFFKAKWELDVVVAMFFIINALLFLAGIISSFQAHDSDPLLVKAHKRYQRFFDRVAYIGSAMDSVWSSINSVLGDGQSCFKELRTVYIASYEAAGEPLSDDFKETLNVDIDRIPGGFSEKLKSAEEDYMTYRSEIKKALEHIEYGAQQEEGNIHE